MIYELKLNFPNVTNCKLNVGINNNIVDFIHIISNQFIFNDGKMNGVFGYIIDDNVLKICNNICVKINDICKSKNNEIILQDDKLMIIKNLSSYYVLIIDNNGYCEYQRQMI